MNLFSIQRLQMLICSICGRVDWEAMRTSHQGEIDLFKILWDDTALSSGRETHFQG